jgi:zinc transporter 1/2/3
MFQNQCLGKLKYEGTTSAIAMAGLFVSFLFDLVTGALIVSPLNGADSDTSSTSASAATNLMVLEAGIVFHSICTPSALLF